MLEGGGAVRQGDVYTPIEAGDGIFVPVGEVHALLHDESEDMIMVLEGGGAVRQGDVYTPIEAGDGIFVPVGEVHGTVNDTGAPARLISFQSPPDGLQIQPPW